MNASSPRARTKPLARSFTTLAAALVLSFTSACESKHEPARPSILLISIDSLRPDHLGCYGYRAPTSPTIDAVAKEGLRFQTAVSTTSWTLPSHAAMFTGLYDSAHGLVDNGLALAPSHRTLAEILKDAGYQTAGFFGGPYLHPTYGLGQGFDHYQSCMTVLADDLDATKVRESSRADEGASHHDITSPRTVEEVDKWAKTADARPFFAFVHFWDVHYDYLPHPGIIELFDRDYAGSLAPASYMQNPTIGPSMAPRDLQHVLALYDNEIRFVDDHIAKVLATLEAKAGGKDKLLVVITADHGEEFFEHGNKGHQKTLFDEVVKVPMVMRWPGHLDANRVVDEQVRLIDLLPTLAGTTGAKVPTYVQGRDLFPLVDDGSVPTAPALLELHVMNPCRALRTDTFKAFISDQGRTIAGCKLDSDPGERTPLPANDPETMKAIVALKNLSQESHAINTDLGGRPVPVDTSPEMQEWLRKLGYGDNRK
ncbi:MAG: sulfatase [Planctomycetes bacterium]|nr:sulfatase [Planctomycetota bacterium]